MGSLTWFKYTYFEVDYKQLINGYKRALKVAFTCTHVGDKEMKFKLQLFFKLVRDSYLKMKCSVLMALLRDDWI